MTVCSECGKKSNVLAKKTKKCVVCQLKEQPKKQLKKSGDCKKCGNFSNELSKKRNCLNCTIPQKEFRSCVSCNETSNKVEFSSGSSKSCKTCSAKRIEYQNSCYASLRTQFIDSLPPFSLDMPLHFVDGSSAADIKLLNNSLSNCYLAGIDTETRPAWKAGCSIGRPTALLQIATRCRLTKTERVFLVDIHTLLSANKSPYIQVCQMLRVFLADDSIVKLGQGLYEDINELVEKHPAVYPSQKTLTLASVIEVNDLHHLYCNSPCFAKDIKVGLQKLCALHLERRLDKSKRLTLSNWEQRPLNASQRKYAACDATVLIRLFDNLTKDTGFCKGKDIMSLRQNFSFPANMNTSTSNDGGGTARKTRDSSGEVVAVDDDSDNCNAQQAAKKRARITTARTTIATIATTATAIGTTNTTSNSNSSISSINGRSSVKLMRGNSEPCT